VDGHSNDGTDEIIKKYVGDYPFLKLCYENYGTMGYARNLGVSESKGDIIAFTDGDAVVPKDWIEKIAGFFADSNLVAVGGLDLLVSSSESDRIIDSWRRLGKTVGVRAIPSIKTVNFAIRRNAVLSCGGFDPELSHWDEAETLARIYSRKGDAEILYDPEVIVYHKRAKPLDLISRIRKTFRKSLVGTSVLMRRHMMKVALVNPISSIGISFLMIPVCIIGILAIAFSIVTGLFLQILVLGFLIYIVALGVYSISIFRKISTFAPKIPLILTVDFIIRFIGTFFGLIRWCITLKKAKSAKFV
jgi:glycosyltransferase involved in cell wall biosynthesis